MKKAKITFLGLALTWLLLPCGSYGQSPGNFLKNPDFQATNGQCPGGQISASFTNASPNKFFQDWYMPTEGTPDVFINCGNACNITPALVCPSLCNFAGTETIFSGQGYAGLYTTGPSQYSSTGYFREYLQQNIVSPFLPSGLIAGQCYRFTMWVSLAESSILSGRIGVAFTKTAVSSHGTAPLNYNTSPLTIPATNLAPFMFNPPTNKNGWVPLDLEFTALGGEKFITIGNFDTDDNSAVSVPFTATPCFPNGPNSFGNGYLFIDRVSLSFSGGGGFAVSPNSTFSNHTFTSVTYINKNIIMNGTINIPQGVTVNFVGCDIRMTKDAEIVIDNGTLNLVSASIQNGCNNTWKGIRVKNNKSCNISTKQKCLIKDAEIAIQYNNQNAAANNAGLLQLDDCIFTENITDIAWNGPIRTAPGTALDNFVKNCSFVRNLPINGGALPLPQSVNIGNGKTAEFNIGLVGAGNTFTGGEYAIKARNYNVNLKASTFTGQTTLSMEFRGQGINGPGNFFKLNVTDGCYFDKNKRHLKIWLNSDATITGSTFANSGEFGIEYSGNYDGKLEIGSGSGTNDPTKANTFINNNWAAVICNDNASSTNPTQIINGNFGRKTEIEIGYNTFDGPAYATGIILSEPVLGSQVKYHKLEINNNTFSSLNPIGEAIRSTNLIGFNATNTDFVNINAYTGFPYSNLMTNIVNFSTLYDPAAKGIGIYNSPGLRTFNNFIVSDAPGSWQNRGILAVNSERNMLWQNYCKSGQGISVHLDMLGSDIFCNSLDNNQVGLQLVYEWLRGSGSTHGLASMARNNYFFNDANSFANIELYNSDKQYNQWVFDGFGTVNSTNFVYTGSTGALSSTVAGFYGTNTCQNIYQPPIVPAVAFDSIDFNQPGVDTAMFFKLSYEKEATAEENNSPNPNPGVSQAFLKKLIKIENLITRGKYQQAKGQFNSLNYANVYEQAYWEVINVVIDSRLPQLRSLTVAEIAILKQIAQQSPLKLGPSVHLARAILKYELNLDYADFNDYGGNTSGGAKIAQGTPLNIAPATVKLYPNPAKSELYIDVQGFVSTATAHLYNVNGQLLGQYSTVIKNGVNLIEVNNLPAGLYLVRLTDQNGALISTQKFNKID